MFERVSTITAKASFAGLYLLVFGWLLWSLLPSAGSWWAAAGAAVLVSPFVVLLGNFVIGPVSLAAGVAAGALAGAASVVIRAARS